MRGQPHTSLHSPFPRLQQSPGPSITMCLLLTFSFLLASAGEVGPGRVQGDHLRLPVPTPTSATHQRPRPGVPTLPQALSGAQGCSGVPMMMNMALGGPRPEFGF